MAGFDNTGNQGDKDNLDQNPISEPVVEKPTTEDTPPVVMTNDGDSINHLTANNAPSNVIDTVKQELDENTNATQKLDVEPAIMAGLAASAIGATATPIHQMQDPRNQQTGADPQTLKDYKDTEESIFTASPNSNAVAMAQINMVLAGAGENLSGVIGTSLKHHNQEEHEEEHKKKHALNHVLLDIDGEIHELIDSMNEGLDDLIAKSDKADIILDNLGMDTEFQVAIIDQQMLDVNYLREEQEKELITLKQNLAGMTSSDDPSYQKILIEQKQAEITNTEAVTSLYKQLKENLTVGHKANEVALGSAQSNLADLQRQKQELMSMKDSNSPEAYKASLEELNTKISVAKIDLNVATSKLDSEHSNLKLTSFVAELSENKLSTKSTDNGSDEYEKEKTATINARTGLTNAITDTIKDGKLNETEVAKIKDLSSKAGLDPNEQDELSKLLDEAKSDSDKWSESEKLEMKAPIDPLVAEKAIRDAKNTIADLNGGTISPEDLKKLEKAGVSTNQLDDIMSENKVTIDKNTLTNNNTTPQIFNGNGSKQNIQIATLDNISPELKLAGGLKQQEEYQSFADSNDFTKYNDPNNDQNNNPSYAQPINNNTDNVASLTKGVFGKDPATEQPTPESGGLTPLQLEAQRLAEEQRLAQMAMTAQNSSGQMGQV